MYEIRHIKEARKTDKVSILDDTALEQLIRFCMATIHLDLMRDLPDINDLNYTIQNIQKVIKTNYGFLGKNEILIAFRKGISKKDGNKERISLVTLEGFLRDYLEERRTIPAEPITDESRLIDLQPDNFKEYEDFLLENWKVKGIVLDLGNSYYNHLEREGLINLEASEKWEYYNKAKAELEKEYQKKPRDLTELRELEKHLERLRNGGKEALIKSRAKQLIVKDYFIKTYPKNEN